METSRSPVNAEAERIRTAYAHRDQTIPANRYSYFNLSHLYWMQQRERDLLHTLKREGWTDLRDKKILEVGCGDGENLRRLLIYKAHPENLAGVDLLPDRIEAAREFAPNIAFHCGNAEELPYPDASFDLVYQVTVFTSIFDVHMQRQVANEMLRVLKPGGLILWYDFHMNNPSNPDVRGVKKKEIKALFPGCSTDLRRVTLAPPFTRLFAPYSWVLCALLEKLPFLCTHYMGVIRKG